MRALAEFEQEVIIREVKDEWEDMAGPEEPPVFPAPVLENEHPSKVEGGSGESIVKVLETPQAEGEQAQPLAADSLQTSTRTEGDFMKVSVAQQEHLPAETQIEQPELGDPAGPGETPEESVPLEPEPREEETLRADAQETPEEDSAQEREDTLGSDEAYVQAD